MRTKAAEQFIRERRRRYRQEAMERRKTRPGALHLERNPAGSKLLKAFYKAKHGVKPDSVREARDWYRSYNPGNVS